MKIGLAQINPIVGDLYGNSQKIIQYAKNAKKKGADLVIYPELCVTGYPPQDLLENPYFLEVTEQIIEDIAREVPQDIGVLIGAPVQNSNPVGKRLYNGAILLEGGEQKATVLKQLLPTYDVFDENRYFESAQECTVVSWRGRKLGVHICEDMWNNEEAGALLSV